MGFSKYHNRKHLIVLHFFTLVSLCRAYILQAVCLGSAPSWLSHLITLNGECTSPCMLRLTMTFNWFCDVCRCFLTVKPNPWLIGFALNCGKFGATTILSQVILSLLTFHKLFEWLFVPVEYFITFVSGKNGVHLWHEKVFKSLRHIFSFCLLQRGPSHPQKLNISFFTSTLVSLKLNIWGTAGST